MEPWLVEIVVGPDTARDEARRGQLRLVAICAGDRMNLASVAVAKHREVLLSVGFSTGSTKKMRARQLRANV